MPLLVTCLVGIPLTHGDTGLSVIFFSPGNFVRSCPNRPNFPVSFSPFNALRRIKVEAGVYETLFAALSRASGRAKWLIDNTREIDLIVRVMENERRARERF